MSQSKTLTPDILITGGGIAGATIATGWRDFKSLGRAGHHFV